MELLTIKSDHKSMVPIKILIKTKWMPGRAGGGGSIPSVHFLQSTHNFGRQAFKLRTNNNPFCKIKIAVSNLFFYSRQFYGFQCRLTLSTQPKRIKT